MALTSDQVEAYVFSLEDLRLREVFLAAVAVAKETADTLSDEFQIAAEVEFIFQKYAARREP